MMYTQQEQRAAIATERLLLVLAAINFTGVVDFLIIMPLGPQYMRVFNIASAQFGLMISAYAITAGLAGILAGIYLDRMDRKKALLGIYAGFTLATLLCGLDPNYPLLLVGRAVTGGFGGVLGALILAIVADAIPERRRGSAMGLVMSSVAMGFVFGMPIGVFLAAHLSWHLPFLALAGLSSLIWSIAARFLPSIRVPLAEAERRREGNRLPVDLFVRRVLHHFQHDPDRTLGGSCGETARFLHRVVAGDCFCSHADQPAPCASDGCPCDHHIFHGLYLWTKCSGHGAYHRRY